MNLTQLDALIDTIATGQKNTAKKVRDVFHEIAQSCYQTGDLKQVSCTNAYMLANFDGTGLGINERVGWKICNGQNSTLNMGGRNLLSYSPASHALIGALGGSADSVLVSHSHGLTLNQRNGENASTTTEAFYSNSGSGSQSQTVTATTTTEGVSGVNKNYSPYVVVLTIQKI